MENLSQKVQAETFPRTGNVEGTETAGKLEVVNADVVVRQVPACRDTLKNILVRLRTLEVIATITQKTHQQIQED